MESLIVHPKNQMETTALKKVLKEMGIRFEKFHTRTHQVAAETKPKSNFKTPKPVDKNKQNLK